MGAHGSGVRRRVYDVLDASRAGDRASLLTNAVIGGLILANATAVVAYTVGPVAARYGSAIRAFDAFCVAVFAVEYVLRLWSVTADPRYSRPIVGRLRFAATPYALIDLLAILPFFLPVVFGDPGAPRLLRLARLFRMLKLVRYSASLRLIAVVFRRERDELLVVAAAMFAVLVLSSSAMYFVERSAQPETFSSIPAAMWWGITTLTTLGYGDVYPVTPLGRVLGGVVAVLGVAIFALPTAILVEGFREELGRSDETVECPHCGETVDLDARGPIDGARDADETDRERAR